MKRRNFVKQSMVAPFAAGILVGLVDMAGATSTHSACNDKVGVYMPCGGTGPLTETRTCTASCGNNRCTATCSWDPDGNGSQSGWIVDSVED